MGVKEQLRYTESLYEVLKYTSSSRVMREMLEGTLDIILEVPWINIEKKGVIFVKNKNGDLELIAQRNIPSLLDSCSVIQSGQCLCGKVLKSKIIIHCSEVDHFHEIHPKGMNPHGHYVFPLSVNHEVLGVLNIYTRQGEVYNQIIFDYLSGVAEILASRIWMLQQVEKEIAYKNTVVKEIHHRVKNNLQIVSSLLSIQKSHSSNVELNRSLSEAQDRIKAISLIHDSVFEYSPKLVSLERYLEKFLLQVKNSFKEKGLNIELEISFIQLDLKIAVPIVLIINELITNSIKHAFRNQDEKRIFIKLDLVQDTLILIFSDNGTSTAKNNANFKNKSLGLSIIESFVDQLEGALSISHENGTENILKIPFQSKG